MSFTNVNSKSPTVVMNLSIPLLIILSLIPNQIKSDLPVHCKREEIEGEWIFRINNELFEPSLADYRSTCGHGFPDKIDKLESDINYSFDNFIDIPIFLGKDYKIYDPISNEVKGKWTPVYDEGFIVNYEKSVFTAFMKYYIKPNLNYKVIKNKKANSDDYLSNCQKTMIGWFIKDENENTKNWACFFGFKKAISDQFNFINNHNNNNLAIIPKKALKPNKNFSFFRYYYFNKKTKKYDKENDDSNENEDSNGNVNQNKNNFLKNNYNNDSYNLGNINYDLLDSLENNSFLEMKTQSKSQSQLKMKLEKIKYEDQHDLIKEINSKNLSWTAHMHEDFKGLSFMDLKMKLGLRDSKNNKNFFEDKFSKNLSNSNSNESKGIEITNEKNKKTNLKSSSNLKNNLNKKIYNNIKNNESPLPSVLLSLNSEEFSSSSEMIFNTLNNELEQDEKESIREKDGQFVTSFEETSKYFDKELDEIDEKTLPKNWDWRNIGGVNYVPEPRMQGNCGSCYVFSMITSLESRLRIKTNNKDKTTFSRQYPISCNFYTEGCDGGYPILVAKFSSEFELIPESCLEYMPEKLKCSDVCDYKKFPKKYFVSKYEYLGGFYGNTNEVEIMKEIRARGPIPGNMTVPMSFSYYKSGIYSQNFIKKNTGHLSKTTMLDNNLSWSSVDHSILLVGYGEENGTKYWIGMNTWGKNWGENGFFRILRGENDCNIETMGDAARISFKFR